MCASPRALYGSFNLEAIGRPGANEQLQQDLLYSAPVMPKMKTHSGAKKRFKLTATGKVKARHAFSSHILEKKSPKRKRELARPLMLSDHDAPRVKILLGAKKK
jgi:large subunit ribosomal protein L35